MYKNMHSARRARQSPHVQKSKIHVTSTITYTSATLPSPRKIELLIEGLAGVETTFEEGTFGREDGTLEHVCVCRGRYPLSTVKRDVIP